MAVPHHITILPTRQTGSTPERLTAGAALSRPHPPVRSLYIHTPFCVHKCHYCDFYSIVDTHGRQQAFVDRLIQELTALAPHAAGMPLRTVFVGGGTPSLLAVELWERLLVVLGKLFDLSEIRSSPNSDRTGDAGAEFTVECNPESASPELMAVLRAGGVNRVSVGAQSFHLAHLKTLERWHNPDNVARAIEAARGAGIPRQSIDLIYAIPGQTLAEWDSDLRTALSIGTTHLSCYNLTYEPATAMTARLARGEFTPTDEDLEAELFEHTARTLAAAGLPRYEVSNFARPGDESLHNLAYWRQEQWLAAGPSASGHVFDGDDPYAGGHRWKNVPRLGDYLESSGYSTVIDYEAPDAARALRERIMMGLRLAAGLDGGAILAAAGRFDPSAPSRLARVVERQAERGMLRVEGGAGAEVWVLTDAGYLIADGIAAELMGSIR